jgi:hypothetical protein
MRGEAVPLRVHRHPLRQASNGAGRAASRIPHLNVDRLALVAAGEQPVLGPGQAPVCPKNAEQLCRQHDVPVLAALLVLDSDHHLAAIDTGDLEPNRLGRATTAA